MSIRHDSGSTDARRTEVLVIGGGQAGLTAGYYLKRAGIPFLILDAESRVGDSWRRRWDTLELFTAARYSSLPGLEFPGEPEHFPGKDEVADYLEAYARTFELPLRLQSRVAALAESNGRYRAETSSGSFTAEQVIVSTGAYQRPYVPALAAKLSDTVTQLHSADYRNPAQLSAAEVVVVGSANSGVQIARDLAPSHGVKLSRGKRLRRLPRQILGKSLHWWGDHLGLISAPLDSLRGRTQRGELLVGDGPRQIARRHGVELVARTVDAQDRVLRLADGGELNVEAVLWATGYRPDYSWIEPPVFDTRGVPLHERGVSTCSGLYFLGMHNQYSRGSSLIHWVRHDAEYIVGRAATAHARNARGAL